MTEYFCESRPSYQSTGFITQYIVQWNARQLCVTWSPGAPHCGVYGKETVSPESVEPASGLRSQWTYRAQETNDLLELALTHHETTPGSATASSLSQHTVSTFRFSKSKLELIAIPSTDETAPASYACSVWKKKPWWQVL